MRARHELEPRADLTWAVCIGAGQFSARADRPQVSRGISDLPAAEREAGAVYSALANPDGCAIPESQLALIAAPDRPATAPEILAALNTAANKTPPEGILVIYFAGHAFREPPRNDGIIYLCGIDAVRTDLPGTAISAEAFAHALSTCPARGILVILDCCVSAGFAEKAPNFFRQGPSGADFRILLAASRADEPSHEFADGSGTLFTKHLVKVLSGQTVVGQSGEMRIVNLVDAVEFGLSEDLSERFPGVPPQRPVIAGWYSQNPKLFVHLGNRQSGRTGDSSRITRTLHRRRLRATVVSGVFAVLFAALSYLTIVDQSRYAEADGSVVRIYQGHPRWKAPGYPHLLEERGLAATVLKPDSVLRRGLPLVAAPGQSIDQLLTQELNELGVVSQLIVEGQHSRARSQILDAMRLQEASPETAHFLKLMLAEVSTSKDVPQLQKLLDDSREEVRNAAMAALLRLSPATAYPLLTASLSTRRFDHRALLQGLSAPCPSGAVAYLTAASSSPEFNGVYAVLPDAALRAKCPLERKATTRLITEYPLFELGDLARYGTESLESDLHLREIEDPYAPLRLALYYAFGRDHACMISLVRMAVEGSKVDTLRETADLLLLSPACRHSLQLSIAAVPEALELRSTELDDPRPLVSRVAPNDLSSLGEALFEQIVLFYEEVHDEATRASLRDYLASVVKKVDDHHLQALALDAARRAGASILPSQNQLNSSDLKLRRAAYMSLAARDLRRARDALFARSNDRELEDWPELISRLQLEPSHISRIRQMAEGGSPERERAIAALAVVGTRADLIRLAGHPDLSTRKILSDYLPARDDLRELTSTAIAPARIEQGVIPSSARRTPEDEIDGLVRKAQKARVALEGELSSVPAAQRSWRARMLLQARSNVWTISFSPVLSSGLKLWLSREADHL